MWSATKNTKCCLTCANWRGPRKDRGLSIETDAGSTRGKCGAGVPADASQGPAATGGRSCSKYIKW